MILQQLLSYVRRACDDYDMISPGDRVAMAVSGGKDSLAALMALAALRNFYPKPFTLEAITVHLGFENFDTAPVAKLCAELDVPYAVVETDIARVVFEERAEKNPCSLCAKLRKGALNNHAVRDGCTRVAYGHNRDDLIHTFFLSLCYEGRLHTLEPVTHLSRAGLYSIRPLMYVPEQDIIGFARRYALPVIKSACPADGNTKRAEIRSLTMRLRQDYDHFDAKVFTAIESLIRGN